MWGYFFSLGLIFEHTMLWFKIYVIAVMLYERLSQSPSEGTKNHWSKDDDFDLYRKTQKSRGWTYELL